MTILAEDGANNTFFCSRCCFFPGAVLFSSVCLSVSSVLMMGMIGA